MYGNFVHATNDASHYTKPVLLAPFCDSSREACIHDRSFVLGDKFPRHKSPIVLLLQSKLLLNNNTMCRSRVPRVLNEVRGHIRYPVQLLVVAIHLVNAQVYCVHVYMTTSG